MLTRGIDELKDNKIPVADTWRFEKCYSSFKIYLVHIYDDFRASG